MHSLAVVVIGASLWAHIRWWFICGWLAMMTCVLHISDLAYYMRHGSWVGIANLEMAQGGDRHICLGPYDWAGQVMTCVAHKFMRPIWIIADIIKTLNDDHMTNMPPWSEMTLLSYHRGGLSIGWYVCNMKMIRDVSDMCEDDMDWNDV
jgi:hypothetical protein